MISFCEIEESCKPIIRICWDKEEWPTYLFHHVIVPIDVTLLILSFLASFFLQYFGDYSIMYQWTKSWSCPIIHLSILNDYSWFSSSKSSHEYNVFNYVINQKYQLYGETPLHVAVREKLHTQVKTLLECFQSYIDFSIEDNFGKSLLNALTEYNEKDQDQDIKNILLKYQEKKHKNQQKRDRVWKEQPIFKAIAEESLYKMYVFNLLGVNWLTLDSNGQCAIQTLLEKMEANQTFLNKVTQMGILDNISSYTILFISCKNGYSECMKVFLENKNENEINVRNQYNGKTPLHESILSNKPNCANVLIDKGADLNAKDTDGKTPLIWALENGQIEVAKLLIEKGAEVHAKNRYGYTPLILAIRNDHNEIAKLLIEKGAELNEKNTYGYTPLILASKCGIFEYAKLLIEKGAEVNAKDIDGWTPIMFASSYGHIEVAKLLIEKGAEVNAKNKYGSTPLILASRNRHNDIEKLLIEKVS